MCERRVARRRGACEEECEPNPKPRPKPNPSSADVAEGGVASIGVRSSGNLQGKEAVLTHTNRHTGRASTVLRLGWLRCPADLSEDGSKGRAQGKEALTHTNRHTGRASTVL